MNLTQQPRRRYYVSFSILLLVLLTTSVCVAEDTAGTCTLGLDGSCIPAEEEEVDVVVGASSLPEETADGYIDTGFGERQLVTGAQAADTRQQLAKMITYMQEQVLAADNDNHILQSVAQDCLLRNEMCAFWAAIGECEANPGTFSTLICVCVCVCIGVSICVAVAHLIAAVSTPHSVHDVAVRPRLLFLRTALV